MMLEAVEIRFAALRAPQPVEWLTDNGSAYTAKETGDSAVALNLIPCLTPVQSPQSNGVAESFVRTFKRDYGRDGRSYWLDIHIVPLLGEDGSIQYFAAIKPHVTAQHGRVDKLHRLAHISSSN